MSFLRELLYNYVVHFRKLSTVKWFIQIVWIHYLLLDQRKVWNIKTDTTQIFPYFVMFSFRIRKDLKRHLIGHQVEYACTLCNKSYDYIGHLRTHMIHVSQLPQTTKKN